MMFFFIYVGAQGGVDAGEVELERGVEECAVMCFGGLQRTPIGNRKHLARERREPDRFQELLNLSQRHLFKIFGVSVLFF